MDYHELNEHVNAYTVNADMCAQTMREWQQQGPKAAIVDLRRAYLQIHIDKLLWPFQTVKLPYLFGVRAKCHSTDHAG